MKEGFTKLMICAVCVATKFSSSETESEFKSVTTENYQELEKSEKDAIDFGLRIASGFETESNSGVGGLG